MNFEQVVAGLNGRKVLLDNLSQIEDGKLWSACVRKQGSTSMGYGKGKTVEAAVKAALAAMRDSMDPKAWKGVVENPQDKKKKKRVKLKGKG